MKTFKSKQDYVNDKMVSWEGQILQVIDYIFKSFTMSFASLECGEAVVMETTSKRICYQMWQEVLDGYFYWVNRGSLGGKLVSQILSEDDLDIVLGQHSELKDTVYNKNLMNLYLASKIDLVDATIVDDRFLDLHYVLHTPALYERNAFTLFKVDKVPLRYNNNCMLVDSPRYIYRLKG